MGLFDKLRERFAPGPSAPPPAPAFPGTSYPGTSHRGAPASNRNPDEVAIERYRYMLKTAPPETIEQAHAEAFARLTPEQRQQVLAEMSTALPEAERARSTDPRDLARMATRAEMSRPGTMEQTLGRSRGPGMGSMIAGTLLASVAGAFIGTAIADAFFDDEAGGENLAGEETGGFEEDAGGDFGGDFGGGFDV